MKNISKLTFLLSITSLLGISSNAFSENTAAAPSEREYLNPQSVQVTENGIFVMKDGRLVRVNSLFTTEKGKIYTKKHSKKHRKPTSTPVRPGSTSRTVEEYVSESPAPSYNSRDDEQKSNDRDNPCSGYGSSSYGS